MPFADYEDFEACERANSDKRDPGAYCSAIKRATEEAGVDDPNVEHLSQLETSAEALDELCQARPEWERYDLGNATAWIGQQSGATVYQAVDPDPPELGDAVVVQGLSDEGREALESKYNVDVVEFFQDVPDDAVSISDRDEAPEGASVITGPRGGLYYVPADGDDGGGGDADASAAESAVSEATGLRTKAKR